MHKSTFPPTQKNKSHSIKKKEKNEIDKHYFYQYKYHLKF